MKTYADLEAAVARNAARYHRSQLTRRPEQNLDNSDLSCSLYYQLPLSERAVYIMASFAEVELDGEYAERMYATLTHRNNPNFSLQLPPAPTARDKTYTQAIFQTIDSYAEAQVRAFCLGHGDYARFRKNLRIWKARCGCKG